MADPSGSIGELVRRYRVAAELTQEELAERAGLSVRAVSDIERGRTARPHGHSVSLLAEALGLAGADLEEFASAAGTDARPGARAGTDNAAASWPAVPRQLPAGLAFFAGRAAELDALDGLLRRRSGLPGAAVLCVISGTPGIGKTTLALSWAHLAADRFPDGQLYVNLRGFEPSAEPVTAAAAIRGFLDALGVPPSQVPVNPQAQADLYRSLLAGRRMLIVADNARDGEQVRPLLPPSASCLVLVTSRNQMTDLITGHGAHPLPLDLLADDDAAELLALRLAPKRLEAEPEAAARLIGLCGGLPLALSIAASRAAIHPHFALASLAAELEDPRGRLEVLELAGGTSGLRAVYSGSYRRLSPAGARVLRLLGVHPGPDVTAPATASLAGVTAGQAREALAELHQASLLTEPAPGRFVCHDLLRAYAAELVSAPGAEQEWAAATRRMLDHYLCTAHAAGLMLNPHRDTVTVADAAPGVIPEDVADLDRAMRWFEAEHRVLLAAVSQAAAARRDTHVWQLSAALTTFLDRRGYWDDYVAVQQAALAAARRLGNAGAQAIAGRSLGKAYALLGRYADARMHLTQALDLFQQLGDRVGQGRAHMTLGNVLDQQDQYADALGHCEKVVSLFRDAGDRPGQAVALNNLGWCHVRLGDYHQALAYCEQAMALHQELGNAEGQASTWDSLGVARQHLGLHGEAIACYEQALAMFRELGDLFNQADVLVHLGDCRQAAFEPDAAQDAWLQALAILDQLHHHDAEQVRAKLQAQPADSARARQAGGRAVGGIAAGSSVPPDR